MKALVLEKKLDLKLRDIDLPTELGPDDVKIKMHTVGICGSDIHYYEHGKIGQWKVNEPMVLGHEAAGAFGTKTLTYLIFQRVLESQNVGLGSGSAGGVYAIILANIVAIFLMRVVGKSLDAKKN